MNRVYVLFAIGFALITGLRAQTSEVQLIKLEELKALIDKQDDTTRIFNFWATWCMPCVRELPFLDSFSRYSLKADEQLFLVSLDDAKKAKAKVSGFVKRKNLTAPVFLLDEDNPNEFIDAIDPTWIGSIPATLVVSRDKRCFAEHEVHGTAELRDWVDNCVNFKNKQDE